MGGEKDGVGDRPRASSWGGPAESSSAIPSCPFDKNNKNNNKSFCASQRVNDTAERGAFPCPVAAASCALQHVVIEVAAATKDSEITREGPSASVTTTRVAPLPCSSSSTCSSSNADGTSGVSTAAGNVTFATVSDASPVEDTFFCEQSDLTAVAVIDDPPTCSSKRAASKGKMLLGAISCPQQDAEDKQTDIQTNAGAVLHCIAMSLSFAMLVALWGVLDVTVEMVAANSVEGQLRGYAVMLVGGLSITMVLKLFQLRGLEWTIHPMLLSSLTIFVAAWGIMDGLVALASAGNKSLELLTYFLIFVVAALAVSVHTCLYDRTFSSQLRRFIWY